MAESCLNITSLPLSFQEDLDAVQTEYFHMLESLARRQETRGPTLFFERTDNSGEGDWESRLGQRGVVLQW